VNVGPGAFLLLAIAVSTTPSWASALPASCGDAKTVIDVSTHKHGPATEEPEAGKARVVFIETADKHAQPVTTRVAMDGTWVGANQGNSYFESTIDPGEHHVCVDWQLNRRFIKDDAGFDVLKAEPGKVYYFLVKVGWTPSVTMIRSGQPDGEMSLDLSPVNEDEGQYLVLNSKFSTATIKK
jgi:hypothetical protein